MGFKLSLYKLYIANKEIDKSQCIVVWYVDNNKILYKSNAAVEEIISDLETKLKMSFVLFYLCCLDLCMIF